MPTDSDMDPEAGALRWARKRTRALLDRFLVGAVLLGVVAIVAGYKLVAPDNATGPERLLYAVGAFGIAVILVGLAVFGWALWRAPYEQRNTLRLTTDQLRRQVEDQSPDFLGRILGVITAPSQPAGVLAYVNLAILNKGFQSIVDHDWQVIAIIGGARLRATLSTLGPSTDLTTKTGERIHLTPADAIYEKGIKPLVRGDQISGWLRVDLPGITAEEFVRAGNVLEITFRDFLGKSYVASYTFLGQHSRAQYFPGSQNPVLPTPRRDRRTRKKKRGG